MQIKFQPSSELALDYLRNLFKADPGQPIRLTLGNDFGRMALGIYKTSEQPVVLPDHPLTVTMTLPQSLAAHPARARYIYFTKADMRRLNLILDALLNIDLDTYYIQGIQAGMQKRDIIESFVISRKLVSVDYADTLSKRTYRSSLTTLRRKADLLMRKARYHMSRIEPPTPR